jgi:hypothetical protein
MLVRHVVPGAAVGENVLVVQQLQAHTLCQPSTAPDDNGNQLITDYKRGLQLHNTRHGVPIW